MANARFAVTEPSVTTAIKSKIVILETVCFPSILAATKREVKAMIDLIITSTYGFKISHPLQTRYNLY
jgi:hypothetical protein